MKYAGMKVLIGGRTLVVPSITLGMARNTFAETLRELVTESADKTMAEKFATALPLFTAAIKRNYPDIADEWIANELDYNNMREMIGAVLGNVLPGELVPGEEVATVEPVADGTGSGSSVALQQPPAGHSNT